MERGLCKLERSCGAVLWRSEDGERRYVLVRGRAGMPGFPKGHVEGAETETETALREIREETGVRAPELDTRFRRTVEYPLPGKPGVTKQVVLFLARCPEDEQPAPDNEIRELLLLPYAEALKTLRAENLRRVLRDAEAYLSGTRE